MKHSLTLQQAADFLAVSTKTVRRMIKRGEIMAFDIGSGKKQVLRIPPAEIDALIERRLVGGTPAKAPAKRRPDNWVTYV